MMTDNVVKQKEKFTTAFYRKILFKKLQAITTGKIHWVDSTGHIFGEHRALQAITVTIRNNDFYRKILWRGSMGAAESYMDGDWDCDDITCLIRIILENKPVFKQLDLGLAFFRRVAAGIKNSLNHNHIKKIRKNILYHYDLSNDLFTLFLDKKTMYSCAVFPHAHATLDEAQLHKLHTICEKLQLTVADHLLEIGTGWGGLAIFAAQNYGCHVTTTTISDAQYDYAKTKITALGLTEKITLLKKDYRELTGHFDKIVSIEMIEAIGYRYFKRFFKVCNQLLKAGGKLLIQTTLIRDQSYERYKYEIDFIRAYIFPGGCLPCLAAITSSLKKHTDIIIRDFNDITEHYVLTLAHWRKQFIKQYSQILALGFNEKFYRMFIFYFCYCEAGFLVSHITNAQILMEKQ